MYECWIDGGGDRHFISEMSKDYIKRCINQIKIAVSYNATKNSFSKEDEDVERILGHKWCEEHAENYLQAFENELEIRRRIRKKDYPSIIIDETCDNCENHKYGNDRCDNGEKCNRWFPSFYEATDELYGNDYEIARRAGYRCNGVLYHMDTDD